jgi:hypothetical protein
MSNTTIEIRSKPSDSAALHAALDRYTVMYDIETGWFRFELDGARVGYHMVRRWIADTYPKSAGFSPGSPCAWLIHALRARVTPDYPPRPKPYATTLSRSEIES